MRFLFSAFLVSAFFVFIFEGCNSNQSSQKAFTNPSSKASDWKISSGIATAMIQSAQQQKCDTFVIIDSNLSIKSAIDSQYSPGQYSRSLITARYVTQADEDRYRHLRGINADSARGKVKGLCNKIYVLKSLSATADESTVYYDIFTVCPPPDQDCVTKK
jgi:hypothetical protein